MRIAINARFLTQRITGVQRYAIEVTRHIMNLLGDNRIYLLAPRNAPSEFYGVKVLKSTAPLSGYAWEQCILPLMFRSCKADVLWSPCDLGPLSVEEQFVTIHDATVFRFPDVYNPWMRRWHRIVRPLLAKRVMGVITVSHFSKAELLKYLHVKPSKITPIYPGISNFFCPQDPVRVNNFKSETGLPQKYVLCLSSLAANKNYGRLIKAWTLIEENGLINDYHLVVVGGSAKSLLPMQIEGLISRASRIRMLGYVEDKHLPLIYSGARLFVFPSIYEGFGFPPLEAMACGVPVVVSNCSAIPEIVGDAGYYFDPCDEQSIAEAIVKVVKDVDLSSNLSRKGFCKIKNYNWEITARQLIELMESALATKCNH